MICINDIFDELKLENTRLSNELLFANKCLLILFKFKDYFYYNYINKCHQTITEDLNDTQLKVLENDLNCLMSEKNKAEINDELMSINDIKCNEQIEDTNCDKQMNGLTRTRRKDKLLSKCKKQNNSFVSDRQLRSTGKCGETRVTYTKLTNSSRYKAQRRKTSKQILVTDLKCDWIECDFYAKSSRGLINHKNRHLGNRPFKCTISGCDKSYYSRHALKFHLHFKHVLQKTIACEWPDCKSMFKTQFAREYHMKRHLTTYEQKPFKCDFTDCTFRALTQNALKTHLAVHSNEKRFKCEVDDCGKTFKLDITLKAHMRTHRSEPHYKCDWPECGLTFRSHSGMKQHKLTKHENIDAYKFYCDWPGCDYNGYRKEQITRHQIIHSDERNFSCTWPHCGKMLKSHRNLTEHLRMHLNDRKHKCQWPGCEYSCVQVGNLKKHFDIHCKKLQQ